MIKASYSDKDLIIHILTKSFFSNKSVNYIIRQGKRKEERIKALMEYSFNICNGFGEVYLSDDRNACALILYPDKIRTTLKTIFWDLKLITYCIGIGNIKKALARETKIKELQLQGNICYLWFIGVDPSEQNKGVGSQLLKEITEDAKSKNIAICLETSTGKNIPWYKKHGFEIFNELDLGYKLYFLKKH
jgi:ribosomal protein S18 acetylase RimI-like enzyme